MSDLICGRGCQYWQQRYSIAVRDVNPEGYCTREPEKVLRRFEDTGCRYHTGKIVEKGQQSCDWSEEKWKAFYYAVKSSMEE